jgi:DNA uptake protein ComE-like DNA-binding protein
MSFTRMTSAAILAVLVASPAMAQAGKRLTIIDANLATQPELLALPHMTPALATTIVEKRPFATVLGLDSVLATALSKEQRTALYGKAFIQVNLNTASKEEILLIPGVGNRMLHEFEEYRPYPALARFHREIDKYVEDAELARLEQYVFVPINLNTASDEDILSIPGIGNRMLREFKEYRPYRSMEQFRREIGKYVNQKELDRLQRYVTLSP